MSNCDFGWELALQVGMILFRWDLKTLYKKQRIQISNKKIILNVVSTISHFWFPTLTTFWQSVFASLISMANTLAPPCPPPTNIFFCEELKNIFFVFCSQLEDFKFLGPLLSWGDLISFLAEGGQAIFFHKDINDQSSKLKNS